MRADQDPLRALALIRTGFSAGGNMHPFGEYAAKVLGWMFWVGLPEEFLKQPVYSREFPPCRHC